MCIPVPTGRRLQVCIRLSPLRTSNDHGEVVHSWMNARPNKVVAADRLSSRAKISLPSDPSYTRLMTSIAPTCTCTLGIRLVARVLNNSRD